MAKSDIQMFRARTSEVEIEFMDDQIQSFDSGTTFWNYGLLNRSNNDILNQKMDKSDKIPVSTFESMFEKFLKWNFVFMGRRLRKPQIKKIWGAWELNLTLILLTKILFWKFYILDISKTWNWDSWSWMIESFLRLNESDYF